MTLDSTKTIRGQTIAKAFAVDGLPQIPLAKKDKLVNVLIKIISQVFPLEAENVEMPFGEDGTSKGFVFVNSPSADIVRSVVTRLDGYKMDKSHTLAIMPLSDIPIYAEAPETFEPPHIEPYQPKEHLKSWLADSMARDQFVTIKSDEVSVFWNSAAPEAVHSRPNWSESFVKWSPKGSFLATMHRQGIALWGGQSWSKINRFSHSNVKWIDFSPNETYVVTWSSEPVLTEEGHEHVSVKDMTMISSCTWIGHEFVTVDSLDCLNTLIKSWSYLNP
jgi:translation initiation factor 3 subunit B